MPDDRAPTDVELDELHDLEAAIWRSETRGDRRWMEQHLAGDSPSSADQGAGTSAPRSSPSRSARSTRRCQCEIFNVAGLVEVSCSVTYQSEVDGLLANRSSIWRLTDAGWQMEFHHYGRERAHAAGHEPPR